MRKVRMRMNTTARKALAIAVVLTTAGAFVSWPSPKAGAMQVAAPGAGQALAIATVNAAAQFGDSVWRTHENGIHESYFWGLTAFWPTVTDKKSGMVFHLGYGNSTPVEYNDTLYMAVPANNEGASDDPSAPGYLLSISLNPSTFGQVNWYRPVTGVSNSAPVIDKATGNVYLASGYNLYGFQPDGTPLSAGSGGVSNPSGSSGSSTDQHNMYVSDPIDQNQVVGYPLYASAQNTGMSEDTIWVGSQNGYLYAFDASDLSQLYKIDIGSRIDGTPVLAYSVSGIPYIIIGTAYSANNKGGTGTLYVIDPRTGKIVSKFQTPSGAPVNGSVIQTAQGYIAWNDYDTDIYYGQLNDNGTISLLKSYWHVGGAGAYSALEAGYAGPSGTYILPVENKAEAAWVDFNNGTSGDIGLLGNAVGAPEISTNHIYVPDATGWVDVFDNSPIGLAGQTNQVANDFDLFNALQHGGQKLLNGAGAAVLTSDFEGIASNPYIGQSVPTFFQPTSGGLAIWQNDGGIYKTSPDYTSADPKDFSQPITLTYVGGDLPTILTNAPNNFDDTLTVQASANGGKNWTTLGTVETFSSGVLNKTITLPTDMLNKAIGITGWNANGPNTVIIKITATPGDLFGYEFESQDEKDIPSPYGQVTVKFPSSVATGYGSWICTNKHGCWDWEGGAIHLWVLQTMEAKTPLWGGKLGDALHGGAFTVYPMNKPSKYNTSRYVTVWAQIAPNWNYIGREFDAHLEAYVEIVKNVPYAYTYISGWTNAITTCVAQNAAGQCTATQSTPPQPIYSTIILHMNVPTVYHEVSPDVRLYWDGGKTNDDTQHLRFAWNIPVPDQGGPWVPCDQAYAGRWRMNPYSLTEWTTGYIDGNTWQQSPVCHADDPLESDWPKGKYPLGVPYPGAQMQWAPYDDMHNNGYQYEPIAGTEYAAWPPNWRVGADEYMPMIIVRAIGDWGDWTDPEITVWTPTVTNGWNEYYPVPLPSKTTVTPNNSK
ncbi:pyrrolo-quinoline quinone [Alicyclobacillus acidocaldarius]|uniref:Pyrrolo-quinoline quinone n=1 Tax=Alicyclobacillus acidocaldarius subsp. acidocaldarius (strain ATCC 27009 / DSM 446 / BCRC 14685 / JCM 5260 / KCTC 1825 / NBRC 15652 / NCIMB 11725 / NRRL B-14509 / 104-IA) TaxID=521098 RepID=C8WSV2_ALIAD|nr:pyrrolo-quinoline quinone [Alicyclobacillus acidocaldarius]ACV57608.1 Pyrrolo-quinoline quinone [Alicyclobacillus acidocaldarius subsp. acidocaldarius DSM 446]